MMYIEVILELLVQLPAYALLIGGPILLAVKIKQRHDRKKRQEEAKKETQK